MYRTISQHLCGIAQHLRATPSARGFEPSVATESVGHPSCLCTFNALCRMGWKDEISFPEWNKLASPNYLTHSGILRRCCHASYQECWARFHSPSCSKKRSNVITNVLPFQNTLTLARAHATLTSRTPLLHPFSPRVLTKYRLYIHHKLVNTPFQAIPRCTFVKARECNQDKITVCVILMYAKS
jgi:hypothetical protein